ncbi:anthranilate phosphoribosyltransferase [Streptomyces sp. NBC_01363]|uniref:anthranilate phosphoribosyltransferase n=1 Tax=Streptomyces sp. NBC_01363 TaxID=2903840 RepID=UPI00224F117F|nr:anthranilate phosphoribosyltransferase [Streptomyces sp. NBC_01363]MCX4733369.1 anthranilate phosphoribosyltransferase [Streptomyces sp. NBC_01363]
MSARPEEPSWPALLNALVAGRDLTSDEAAGAMEQIMTGGVTGSRLAGFLMALRSKGETVDEMEGLARTMWEHAVQLRVPGPIVDIVGTGGDGSDSVNISTISAIVAAGAGARVVKHGNRSASSQCGSADVLEELGITIDLPPSRVAAVAMDTGITFCFAPAFHPAMRHAAPTRRELGVRTAFNLLGPLSNPASPTALAVGVADLDAAPLIAGVLARQGVSALVFRGDDGMDELTVTTTSRIWSVGDGQVHEEVFDPRELGVPPAAPDALRGGDRSHNGRAARALLAGARGPVRDAVLLSAAAALAAVTPAPGRVRAAERIAAALPRAAEAIDSGAAADVLERWAAVTAKHAADR